MTPDISAEAPHGRLRDRAEGVARAFLKAAVQPAPAALGIALLINVILCGGLILFVTPTLLSGPERRFLMEDQYDRSVALIGTLQEMRAATTPRVVVLGGSLVVRCIASEEELAMRIAAHGGDPAYEVRDLSVDGQTTWGMAALAESFAPTLNGIVVIGLGPEVLGHGSEDFAEVVRNPRIGFRTTVLDSIARAAGRPVQARTGNYFLDNWRFLASRGWFVVRNLRTPPDPEPGEQFDKWWMQAVNNPGYWAAEIERVGELESAFNANKAANLAVIDWVIEKLTADGRGSIIILEAPFNPRWEHEPDGKAFYARYRAELREFVADRGLHYMSATERAKLIGSDFVDYEGHIGEVGARARCTDAVAGEVARVMRNATETGHHSSQRGEQ